VCAHCLFQSFLSNMDTSSDPRFGGRRVAVVWVQGKGDVFFSCKSSSSFNIFLLPKCMCGWWCSKEWISLQPSIAKGDLSLWRFKCREGGTLLGFTCILFPTWFHDLQPRRWLKVVECENRVWRLHLTCTLEEICRKLEGERESKCHWLAYPSESDGPLTSLAPRFWSSSYGMMKPEKFYHERKQRKGILMNTFGFMPDATRKQYLLKLWLKVDSPPSPFLPLPTPPHLSKPSQHMLLIPSTSILIVRFMYLRFLCVTCIWRSFTK
jgi:hypothetical protein